MSGRVVVRAPGIAGMFIVLASWLLPVDAHAAWSRDPYINLPVSVGVGQQVYPAMVEDGAGGAFIAWHDNRGPTYDIYMQRVSAAGAPLWTTNGIPVCAAAGDQANAQLVQDGAGGVIVVWHDYRAGNWDVYAQRLNANGVAQWTANGVALCSAPGDQPDPNIVADGQGGAIAVWKDNRSASRWDAYAQRVNASGAPQWTANGVVVSNDAAGIREVPRIASDGAGGAIMTWQDLRSGSLWDIYAQRVNGSGVMQWTANGVVVTSAFGSQLTPCIAPDAANGAYIAWIDFSGASRDLRMQRVSPTGGGLWGTNGLVVCDASFDQDLPQIIADGIGGAIVTWQDYRDTYWRIFAQRMSSAGVAQWGFSGANVAALAEEPHLVSDGAGGAIIVFRGSPTGGTGGLRAQRMNANGSRVWGAVDPVIADAAGEQSWPRIVSDGVGGAIVTWHDPRSGSSHDIYAQRVDHYGYLGNVDPVITSVRDVPNDQGGKLKVSWNASPLDAPEPNFGITEYRLWRSVPSAGASGAPSDSRPARATTEDPDVAAAGDALLLMSSAGAVRYWEYVGSQEAAAFPSYGMTTFTPGDSLPDSNPHTLYMVEARGGTSVASPRWYSAPDSGYSVDNLAPATPTGLAGMFLNGVTVLHWATNSEADLAHYRLHRGSSAGFTPSPANRIASPINTNFDDPSGVPSFYKLSAVDIHGNESGFALLTPSGLLDAPVAGLSAALRLALPQPNPTAARARIAFDLPRAAHVSLAVYDAGGRAVRELFRGSHDAGAFSVSWDLRDDAGRVVADGVYFVRLESEGRRLTQRIIAMR